MDTVESKALAAMESGLGQEKPAHCGSCPEMKLDADAPMGKLGYGTCRSGPKWFFVSPSSRHCSKDDHKAYPLLDATTPLKKSKKAR